MRTRTLIGATALCVLMLASPASAGIEVGEEAPDFQGEGYFNTEPITVGALKGRLIFLELFSTT